MEKMNLLMFLFLLASFLLPLAYGFSELHIDCGATNETNISYSGIIKWVTDEYYIEKGQNNMVVSSNNFSTMNTLRYFPIDKKSCYKLPADYAGHTVLLRAGFYYGNYDGFNKPPSFDLEVDGNLWANVVTSGSEDVPVFYELIYRTVRDNVSVCLVRTSDDIPIISSLEGVLVYDDSYTKMASNTALHLHSRINYGANKSIEKLIDIYAEQFLREWTSVEMTEYINISMDYIPDGYVFRENEPPWPVMATAIQAKNFTDSIYLTVDFLDQTQQEAYFVLYFMNPLSDFDSGKTGRVDVYIDNQKLNTTDVPNFGTRTEISVVTLYPINVTGSANVTISPAVNSTLPPLVNAMEVFIVTNVKSEGNEVLHSVVVFISCIFLHLVNTLVLH
ncbi:hypothetical protein ACFE04_004773 [Oxalis oulophora]